MTPATRSSEDITMVEVWLDDATLGGPALVGQLNRRPSRTGDTIDFTYAPGWLESAPPHRGFPLDPQLLLGPGAKRARAGAASLTGAFLDCSPDRWGKVLMDRREVIAARAEDRRPRTLRHWDYLLGVNDESRMGALRLRTPDGPYLDDDVLSAPPMTELRQLEAIARRMEQGDTAADGQEAAWIRQLVAPGASLGGARPKAGARDAAGSLWMAKFPSADDRRDVGLWEYITHRLALQAGIVMSQAMPMRLSGHGTTYAVQRFDRTRTGQRRAYASAFTLLDVDDSEDSSYLDLVETIEHQGVPDAIEEDLHALFRRVAFNVLVGNRDDHLRNHGFLRAPGGWRLSPAFDVNPNPDKDVHVLAIGADDPTPDSRLLLEVHDFYRLQGARAREILDEVRHAVRPWQEEARRCGARAAEVSAMVGVIDPER